MRFGNTGVRARGTLLLAAAVSWPLLCATLPAEEGKPATKKEAAACWSDWPHFLGPDRNGSSPEKGLLRQWPEDGPKVLWKAPIGVGYGAPSVSKGAVFLLGGIKGGKCVWCLDAFTGELRWEFKYETRKENKQEAKRMEPGWGYCPRATVTATEEHVYSIDEIGEAYCLDRKTGKEVWFRDLDTDYKPSHNDWKGWCASPLVAGGVVITPVLHDSYGPGPHDAKLVGLDARTGKTAWEWSDDAGPAKMAAGSGGDLFVTPQLADFADEPCAVWPAISGLVAVRVSDGKKVWDCADGRSIWLISPQVTGDQIYLGRLLQVDRRRPPFETRVVWKSSVPYAAYTYCTPVRCGDYAYTFLYMRNATVRDKGALNDARLSCIDLKTGQEVWKKEDLPHGVSLTLADGMLFARSKTCVLLLDASPEGYREKGKVDLKGKTSLGNTGWVMPVIAYGRLYIRCENEVVCFQAAEKVPSREDVDRCLGGRKGDEDVRK